MRPGMIVGMLILGGQLLIAASLGAACDDLRDLAIPGLGITALEAVPAGDFQLQGGRGGARQITDLPAFCRVAATLSPVGGSRIRIELWLPDPDVWNGRYLALGNGGFAASIPTNAMMDPLRQGYATSSTDTGHTTPGGDFALDEVQLVDFAWRAVHEMAEGSKHLIDVFYGRSQDYAFFNGCSTGGRQALTAAQRYPEDFDGIVAGAPANYTTHLQGQQLWMSRVGRTDGFEVLGGEQLSMIQSAVLASCDLDDGVGDLVLENPLSCSFDPASLACAEPGGEACLTPGEVATLTRLYDGPTDASGNPIFFGSAMGSEGGWGQMTGAQPLALAVDVYRYMVFRDDSWSFESFDAQRDIPYGVEVIGDVMDAADPDLGPLIGNGGKLLIYHGWADPGITPYSSVGYYEDVLETLGEDARESVRLFMVPGMGHCGGGEGPGTFDSTRIIDDWVTSGNAPDVIVASRTRGGQIDRTRPLCPYPQIGVYDGSGSTDQADNFTCREP